MLNLQKKDALIGVGVAVGAAVLVLFLQSRNANSAATGGNLSGGVTDIMGGYSTAGTVYVPTSAYTKTFNTYKGAVTYSTTTNNDQTTATTTYSASDGGVISGNVANPITKPPAPVASPPHITTNSPAKVNPSTKQTNTTPKTTAPKDNAPKWESALQGKMHYATPKSGWDPNSVVDNLKSHGYNASQPAMNKLAGAMNIKNYKGTANQNVQMLNNLKKVGK